MRESWGGELGETGVKKIVKLRWRGSAAYSALLSRKAGRVHRTYPRPSRSTGVRESARPNKRREKKVIGGEG